jgi:hypothetical protein
MAGSRPKKGHRENSGYDRNIAVIMPSNSHRLARTGRIKDAKKLNERGEPFHGDPARATKRGQMLGNLFSRSLRPASVVTEIVGRLV